MQNCRLSLKHSQEPHTGGFKNENPTILQPRSMHRAEMLMQQQQQQKQDGWQFVKMSRFRYDSIADAAGVESVYDDEQGGAWVRKEQRMARADRGSALTRRANRYDRPVTRFGDLMDGLSHITKGLQKVDQASDGDLGEAFFELLR